MAGDDRTHRSPALWVATPEIPATAPNCGAVAPDGAVAIRSTTTPGPPVAVTVAA